MIYNLLILLSILFLLQVLLLPCLSRQRFCARQQVGRNSKAYCAKVNHVHDISLQSYLLDQQGIVISSQQINAKK